MHHIRPDLAVRALDQLLHLFSAGVDEAGPRGMLHRIPASVPQADVPLHGLAVIAGQLRRRPSTAGQVERLQDFHDLLALLCHGASLDVCFDVVCDAKHHRWKCRRNGPATRIPPSVHREIWCPSAGTLLSAYWEDGMSAVRGRVVTRRRSCRFPRTRDQLTKN